MILRGVIQAVRVAQRNQVFVDVLTYANSVNKDVPLFAQFGIASVPKVGTRCICLCLNGDYEALICIAAQSMTNDGGLSEGKTQVGSNEAVIKFSQAIEAQAADMTFNAMGQFSLTAQGLEITSNGEELLSVLEELLQSLSTVMSTAQISTVGTAAATAMSKITAMK